MGGPTTVTRERPGLADLVIVLAGVAIAVAAVAPIALHWLTNPPDQRLVDLDVYRSGGQAVLRGAPVYDVLTQPPQLLPFTYPPFAALLAVPLALIPWPVAQWLWVALLYAALVIAVCYAFRDLIRRAGRWAPVATGALVGATAQLMSVGDQIRFGQVGLFLVALCVADCVIPSPRWPRGVLIGLATAIKLVPGVFLIYLLITGRREAAKTATMTAVVATLGAFAVLPGDSVDFWFGAVLDGDRVGAGNGTTNQSIHGMLLRLYWPDAVTTLVWGGCLIAMAYLGFRLARGATLLADRLRDPADARSAEMAGVAIVGLLSVLLSPVGWIHHLVWLVVVLGVLVGAGRDRVRLAVAGAVWLLYVFPVPYWGVAILRAADAPPLRLAGRLVQSSYGLGAVALVVLLGVWLLRRAKLGNISISGRASTKRMCEHAKPQVASLDS
jgi:alpha-1,2-mannosyltransferase